MHECNVFDYVCCVSMIVYHVSRGKSPVSSYHFTTIIGLFAFPVVSDTFVEKCVQRRRYSLQQLSSYYYCWRPFGRYHRSVPLLPPPIRVFLPIRELQCRAFPPRHMVPS